MKQLYLWQPFYSTWQHGFNLATLQKNLLAMFTLFYIQLLKNDKKKLFEEKIHYLFS